MRVRERERTIEGESERWTASFCTTCSSRCRHTNGAVQMKRQRREREREIERERARTTGGERAVSVKCRAGAPVSAGELGRRLNGN